MIKVDYKEVSDLRQMLVAEQIRICQMAMALHKETERIDNLLAIIDSWLIKKEG